MIYHTKLNSILKELYMKKILSAFLILLLIPISQGFAQEYSDNAPTLSASLVNETPYVYTDSEGYTVVVGAVENNNGLTPITNIQLQVLFFDDFDPNPIEIVEGTTTLEVIPKNGQSPFAIRSDTPNPKITQASVSLLGFDSSVPKPKGLTVYSSEIFLGSELHFSGVIQNGGAPISDTNVYLAFYDAFQPPRILGVSTIEIGEMEPNTETEFEFNEPIDTRAVGLLMFSDSDVFYSDFVNVEIPPPQAPTKLVTISNVSVEDRSGNKLSEIPVGSTVNIKSETKIEFTADPTSNETAYTYYVQIKESGTSPTVEFIGKFDGRFIGTGDETQTIDWIPQKGGLYFIETFVWDRNNIPIAEQGQVVLIFVN